MPKIKLPIRTNVYFDIVIAALPRKLHLYSEGSVVLNKNKNSIIVCYKRPVYAFIDDLYTALQAALHGERELDARYQEKGIGYWSHIESIRHDLDKVRYDIWGTKQYNSTTWLYTISRVIFIETSPEYPWDDDYLPTPGDGYITYETFMKHHTPIAKYEISPKTAHTWLNTCETLLTIMRENG